MKKFILVMIFALILKLSLSYCNDAFSVVSQSLVNLPLPSVQYAVLLLTAIASFWGKTRSVFIRVDFKSKLCSMFFICRQTQSN